MSGVVIDVDTRAGTAQKDLQELNKSLAMLVKSSNDSSKALGGISANQLKGLTNITQKNSLAMKSFGVESSKALGGVTTGATGATNALGSLKAMIVSVGASFLALKGVNAFHKAADDLTIIQNKLKLVVEGQDELIRKQRQLFQISKETGMGFSATADTFTKFSKSMEGAGVSSTRMLKITRTINEAAAMSGSSAESVNAAMIQLNQGIASGVLRGEEFNSVTEQMMYLSQGLAKTLGVTQGKLRAMAADGLLTSDLLIKGLEKMVESTSRDFKKVTFTVDQAMSQMRSSISYFLGDINKTYGFADRFAKTLMKMGNTITSGSDAFIQGAFDLKQSIRNYIRQFDIFDATTLTVKAMVRMNISPMDAYDKYTYYKSVKKAIDSTREFFGKKPEKVDVKVKPKVNMDDVSIDNDPKAFLEQADKAMTLKDKIASAIPVFTEFGRAIGITFTNLAKLLPTVLGPVQTVSSKASHMFNSMAADMNAWVYKTLAPATRVIESFTEALTLWSFSDTTLERAWVNLFRSSSLKEFIDNFRDLNDVRAELNWDDQALQIEDFKSSIFGTSRVIEDVLISLNLMDNRLIRISNLKMNRIIDYFKDIGKVTTRLYRDLLAPVIEPLMAKAWDAAKVIGETLYDGLRDTLNPMTGEKLAKELVSGLKSAFVALKKFAFDDGSNESVILKMLGVSSSDVLKERLIELGKGAVGFISGFFKGIYSEVTESLSGNVFEKAFDALSYSFRKNFYAFNSYTVKLAKELRGHIAEFRIKYFFNFDKSPLDKATNYFYDMIDDLGWKYLDKLYAIEFKIKNFINNIKNYFYDIWDKVVGHSYWPDMIDGVVAYTDNLWSSDSKISSFAERVKGTFKGLFNFVIDAGQKMGGAFADFSDRLSSVDWGTATKSITSNIGASILAGMLFAFGDIRMKVMAANYFFSLFNVALNNAFTAFGPTFAAALGASGGALAEHMVNGAIKGLKAILEALPSFVQSFISAFGPLGSVMSDVMSLFPLFHNNLLYGITALAAAYAMFAKKGGDKISEILFGKENKKKGTKTDGIVDYLKDILNIKPVNSKSITDQLFDSKKLAMASAAVMSTALLDGISFIDAATLAFPLMGYAIMGKDGGTKLIQDATSVTGLIISGMYRSFSSTVAELAGKNSIIAKIFEWPLTALQPGVAKTKGSIQLAAESVLDGFKQAVINLRTNAKEYAAGKMSLMDAMMMSPGPQMTMPNGNSTKTYFKLDLKDRLKNMFDEISNFDIGSGTTLKSGFTNVKQFFQDGLDDLTYLFQKSNVAGKIKDTATSLYRGIKDIGANSLSLLGDGMTSLLAIIKNKFVLLGALTVGLSSMAFAASDASTAITEFGGAVGTILIPIVAITAALGALGATARLFQSFKKGKADFIEATLGSSLNVIDLDTSKKKSNATATYIKQYKDEAAQRAKAFLEAQKSFADKIDKESDKVRTAKFATNSDPVYRKLVEQELASVKRDKMLQWETKRRAQEASLYGAGLADIVDPIDRAGNIQKQQKMAGVNKEAMAAGIQAVKDQIIKLADKAKNALIGIGEGAVKLAASPALMAAWWIKVSDKLSVFSMTLGLSTVNMQRLTTGSTLLSEAFTKLRLSEYAAGFKALAESLKLLSAGMFSGGIQAVAGAFGALRGSIGGVAGIVAKVGAALRWLWGLVSRGAMLLLPLMKIPAMIVGVVSAIGAIGLYFFGPGETFFDNLEWAYDKVKSFFGLKPTTAAGRLFDIKKDVKNVEVGDQRIDMTAYVNKIDFAKMRPVQFKVFEDTTRLTKEGLDGLNELYIKQGYLTDAQLAELERLQADFKLIAMRQPQKEDQTMDAQVKQFSSEIQLVDNSLWTLTKRMFGWQPVLTKAAESTSWFTKTVKAFSDYSTLSFAAIGASIGIFFGPAGALFGGIIGGVIGFIVDIGSTIYDGWAKIGGWVVGLFEDKIMPAFRSIFDKGTKWISEAASTLWTDLKDRFSVKPSKDQKKLAADTTAVSEDLTKYFDYLPSEVQKATQSIFDDFTEKAKTYQELKQTGYTGLNANSMDDFKAKEAKALKEFEEAKALYFNTASTYGQLGKENFLIKQLKDRMNALTTGAKEILDIDLGAFAKDFMGNGSDVALMEAYVQAGRDNRKVLERATNANDRAKGLRAEAALKQQAKALQEQVTAYAFMPAKLDFQLKVLGENDAMDALTRLRVGFESQYEDFTKATQAVRDIQVELNALDADAPAAKLQELYEKLFKAKQKAAKSLPATTFLSDINKRLQTTGVDQIGTDKFVFFKETQAAALASRLDQVKQAQIELDKLEKTGAPFSEQIAALLKIQGLVKGIKSDLMQTIASNVKDVLNDPNKTTADKAVAVSTLTGDVIPENIGASEKKLAQWVQLEGVLANSRATLEQMRTGEIPIDTATFAKANGIINRTTEQIGKLNEKITITLDSLLGKLGETGVAVSEFSFASIDRGTQTALAAIGSQVEMISKRLSEASIKGIVGDKLTAMVDKKIELLRQAREILLKTIHLTSAGITEGLGRIGISDTRVIAKMSSAQIKAALDIDRDLVRSKSEVATAKISNIDDYIVKLKEQAKLEKQASYVAEDALTSFATITQNINNLFKTSLNDIDMSRLSNDMVNTMATVARYAKRELENVYETGVTSTGESAKSFFIKLRDLARQGEYVSLFAQLAKDMEDSLVSGAKAGFERLKTVVGDAMEFMDFARIDPSQRRNLTQQSVQVSAFDRALELSSLSPELASILNKVGSGADIATVMTEFETKFEELTKTSLADTFKTPLEKSVDVQRTLINAIVDNTAALRGQPTPKKTDAQVATVGSSSTDTSPTAVGDISYSTYLGRDKQVAAQTNAAVSAALAKMDLRQGAGFLGRKYGFDAEATNLANQDQLRQAYNTADSIRNKEIELQNAMRDGLDTIKLQTEILQLKDKLQTLGDGIRTSAMKSTEAGKALASSINDVFTTSATDLITGKTTWIDARDNVMDSVSSQIVNTMMKGLMDPLIGNNSALTDIFKEFGKTIFEQMASIFSGSGSNSGSSTGDAVSGIFSAVKGWFGYASGGSISGPGTSTSDSIPAMLSNGEFVINAKSAKKFRPLLEALNNGGQHFANGGIVRHFSEGGAVDGGIGGGFTMASVDTAALSSGLSSIGSTVSGLSSSFSDLGLGVSTMANATADFSATNANTVGEGFKEVGKSMTQMGNSVGRGFNSIGVSMAMAMSPGKFDWVGAVLTLASAGMGLYSAFTTASTVSNTASRVGGWEGTNTLGNGITMRAASGGFISGPGTGTSDSIPAMLSNGEFVMRAAVTKQFLPLLSHLNNGEKLGAFASGGLVGTPLDTSGILTMPSNVPITKAESSSNNSQQVFNINVTGDISRQTRAEIQSMMPAIAAGVNQANYESGYR